MTNDIILTALQVLLTGFFLLGLGIVQALWKRMNDRDHESREHLLTLERRIDDHATKSSETLSREIQGLRTEIKSLASQMNALAIDVGVLNAFFHRSSDQPK